MGASEFFEGGEHAVKAEAGADAGKLLGGEQFCEVIVAATGADAADAGEVCEDGFVDGAGVIIESAGDGDIEHHASGRPAAWSDAGEQFPEVLESLLTGGAADEHVIEREEYLVGITAELSHVKDAGGRFGGHADFLLHFSLNGIATDFIQLIKTPQDTDSLVLQIAGFKESVENFSVVDADGEAFDADAFEQIVDDEECFDVGGVAECADGIEVALQKFAEATAGGPFSSPHRSDVIPSKRRPQFLDVLSGEACEWDSEIEAHGDVAFALVGESEHLFVRFFAAFSQQYFGVFERRRVDGCKSVAAVDAAGGVDQLFAGHHLIGEEVAETAEGLRFDALDFFVIHGPYSLDRLKYGQTDRTIRGSSRFGGEDCEGVFPELFGGFEVLVIDAVIVVLAFIRGVGSTDVRSSLVDAAAIVGLNVFAVSGHHQEPVFAVNKDGKGAMEHVPADVVELLSGGGSIDLHGEVSAAAGSAVAAENFAWGQVFAGNWRCGHVVFLETGAKGQLSSGTARVQLRRAGIGQNWQVSRGDGSPCRTWERQPWKILFCRPEGANPGCQRLRHSGIIRLLSSRASLRRASAVIFSAASRQQEADRVKLYSWKRTTVATLLLAVLGQGCAAPDRSLQYVVQNGSGAKYYRDYATSLEYPAEPEGAETSPELFRSPRTITTLEDVEQRPVTLNECVRMALSNAAIIRDDQGFLSPGNPLLANPQRVASIYDSAIQDTGFLFGSRGTEASLSDFDPVLTSSLQAGRSEDVQNTANIGLTQGDVLTENSTQWQTRLEKAFAHSGTFAVENNWSYSRNNQTRLFDSAYTGVLQAEYRQPLLAAAGTEFTRIAGPAAQNIRGVSGVSQGVLISRINSDISLLDFEQSVTQMIRDVENKYWDLYLSLHLYHSEVMTFRDIVKYGDLLATRAEAQDTVYQAQNRLYEADARIKGSLADVLQAENRLRRLMGLPLNDGQFLTPTDHPSEAKLVPAWDSTLTEALAHRTELRRQKWEIRSLELQLKAARNLNRPRLDFVSQYRVNGFGDTIGSSEEDDDELTDVGYKNALESLTQGNQTGWGAGLQFSLPLGLRLARAQVRNYELRLRKARRVLEVQEEEVARELNNAVLEMDRWYLLAESGSKRADVAINYAATAEERVASDNSRDPSSIGRVLEAKITSRDADQSYLRSIVEYNKAINELNFRKGTLLQANSIYLAEGEWNPLAYQQAAERGEAISSGLDNNHVEATPEEFTRGPAPSAWESRGDPTRPFVPGALEPKSPAVSKPVTQPPVAPAEKSVESTLEPTVPPRTTSATSPTSPKIRMPATSASPERLPATRSAQQLPRVPSPGQTPVNASKTAPNPQTQPPTRSPQPASPRPAAKPGPPQQSLPVIPPPAPRPPLAEKAQPAPPAKQLAPPMVPAVPAEPPVPAKPVSRPAMVPRDPLTSPTLQMRPLQPGGSAGTPAPATSSGSLPELRSSPGQSVIPAGFLETLQPENR